jgi:hypothetical protein
MPDDDTSPGPDVSKPGDSPAPWVFDSAAVLDTNALTDKESR